MALAALIIIAALLAGVIKPWQEGLEYKQPPSW